MFPQIYIGSFKAKKKKKRAILPSKKKNFSRKQNIVQKKASLPTPHWLKYLNLL